MKVVCERPALLDAINVVSGVVAGRTPKPQLTCVRLCASTSGTAGQLTLSGTDAEVSLALVVGQVDVEEEGLALIPADKLRQIVSAEDHEPTLTLKAQGDDCQIDGDDAHFTVRGYPPDEFPPIPSFTDAAPEAKATFSQQAGLLRDLISRTIFATARETSRYAINGVLLRREDKRLEMVATDGRRLALCRTTLPGKQEGEDFSCIVPSKALSLLLKLMDDPEEPIQVAITDSRVFFCLGQTPGESRATLVSNLVEGTFPPYDDVIPKDQDKKIVFDRDSLSSAVRRAALLTSEESRGVRLTFTGKDKRLELASRAPEMGEAHVSVDLSSYEGDDIEIGFNPGFLTEALKVIPDPEVILELKTQSSPGLIRSGADFLYVVMPVTIS